MFDGNGNWTSDFSAQADRDNGIKILASRFDNIFIADIKESFENCLTKDGQIMPIGNFNMGGQRITNMADGVNGNDAVNKNQLDSLLPVGLILPYGGTTAPTGFLLCDGSAVSRTTYASLFAVIGTTYGAGDGSTTFNLPNSENIVNSVDTSVSVKGTGKTLGLTDANKNVGLFSVSSGSGYYIAPRENLYNKSNGTTASGSGLSLKGLGVTTTASESGLIGTATRTVLTCKYLIKY